MLKLWSRHMRHSRLLVGSCVYCSSERWCSTYDPDVCGSLSSFTCCPQASIDRKPPSPCHDKSLSRSLTLSFCFLCSQNIRTALNTYSFTKLKYKLILRLFRMKQAIFAAVTLRRMYKCLFKCESNCSVLQHAHTHCLVQFRTASSFNNSWNVSLRLLQIRLKW